MQVLPLRQHASLSMQYSCRVITLHSIFFFSHNALDSRNSQGCYTADFRADVPVITHIEPNVETARKNPKPWVFPVYIQAFSPGVSTKILKPQEFRKTTCDLESR